MVNVSMLFQRRNASPNIPTHLLWLLFNSNIYIEEEREREVWQDITCIGCSNLYECDIYKSRQTMFPRCKCPIKEYWLGFRRCMCTLCSIFFCKLFILLQSKQKHKHILSCFLTFVLLKLAEPFYLGGWLILLQEMSLSIVLSLFWVGLQKDFYKHRQSEQSLFLQNKQN